MQEALCRESKSTCITQKGKGCPNSDSFTAFCPHSHHLGPASAETAADLLPCLTPLALLPGTGGKTYTEEPSLALRVAEHFIHGALVEWVDSLAGQFVRVQQVQWVAGLRCNEDIREQEEHPALQFFSL